MALYFVHVQYMFSLHALPGGKGTLYTVKNKALFLSNDHCLFRYSILCAPVETLLDYENICQAKFDFNPTNLSYTTIRVGRCL